LLSWVAKSAWRKDILVAHCSFPKAKEAGGGLYGPLLAAMAAEENGWMGKKARGLLRNHFGYADIRLHQAKKEHAEVAKHLMHELPQRERLLLIMDGVECCERKEIDDFLFASRMPIRENYPLSLVLTGTPLLDACLARRRVDSVAECDRIYLGALSDEEAKKVLREQFSASKPWIGFKARDALLPLTENHWLFIQLAGSVVWEAAASADIKEIDVKLVKKCEGDIRKAKEDFFASCHKRLEARGLLPYAQPVMELLDGNGGKASAEELEEAVAKAKPRPKGDGKVEEVCDGLHEESFVWTVYDEVRPGIPSLFDYVKAGKK
ncbi:MAG: hypothetical protein ISN26_07630, partial [Betaproteobacteria bacterium AqS2]|nr:hypothetical protein [Betaproteobacteria bacterium AqS2]